jgi:hypothetical protein
MADAFAACFESHARGSAIPLQNMLDFVKAVTARPTIQANVRRPFYGIAT